IWPTTNPPSWCRDPVAGQPVAGSYHRFRGVLRVSGPTLRSGISPAGGIEPANRDQGESKVADLDQQPVERGLVGEHAEDDRLLPLALDLQAIEPGGPPAVQDARDADLIPRRPAAGSHLIPRELLVLKPVGRRAARAARHIAAARWPGAGVITVNS